MLVAHEHRRSGWGGVVIVLALALTATACVVDLAGVQEAADEYMQAVVDDDADAVHAMTCVASGLTVEEVEDGLEHGRTQIGIVQSYDIETLKATRSTAGPPSALATGTVELDTGDGTMGIQLLKEDDGWRVCDLRIDE